MQQYRYAIEIYDGGNRLVDQAPASVDWDPALEWTWLQGLRRGELQLTDGTRSSAIVPQWHPDFGQPYVAGFRVTILAEHAAGVSEVFSTDYFRSAANAAARRLVEEDRLTNRDGTRFLALAFFNEDHAQAGPAPPFRITEAPPHLTLGRSSLAEFTARSTRVTAAGETNGDGVPIVIPRRVLDEDRDVVQTLFGWRRGVIEERGYYVFDGARRNAHAGASESNQKRKRPTKPQGGE